MPAPDEAQRAAVGVVAIDPFEAARLAIEPMQRRLAAIERVQVAHPTLHTAMRRELEQVPLDAVIMAPLAPLADVAAHEQQLLPGLHVHVAEQHTQIGELLPIVTRHPGQ